MVKGQKGKTKGPRMISEIQRLKAMGLSKRMIAKSLGCSRNTVDKYLSASPDADSESPKVYRAAWSDQVKWIDVESATSRGMTLSEFWERFISLREELKDVSYLAFWREYRRRFPNIPIELHKTHPPGERCEIDYKGDSPGLGFIDRYTREYVPCRLFGSILCFSQLFFPRATLTEKQDDLLKSISEAYKYFGGVPVTSAFDNAKAAVSRAHRYDPDINKEFAHFCEHYGTAPLAMRPRKPKDKNLIENNLGVFWRWARQRIQEKTFHSLADLNDFIYELAEDFNNRTQRKYGTSRRQKFIEGEQDKLLELPSAPYSVGNWKTAKPHPDCHVQIGKNFYSIPHQHRDRLVDVRITGALIEIYRDLDCIARHIKAHDNAVGQYFTNENHLPDFHKAMREATPQQSIDQASEVGPFAEQIIKSLIEDARHPLMYLRRAQGILRLSKRYSPKALDRSSEILLSIGTKNPKLSDVEALIKNNLDSEKTNVIPIKRQSNPFLRGQEHWGNQ
ncbi:MAG: IS21 family transposase [Proteobacteria bacterium]|nr:MAG: IS21 family transposase [Pseudomonadota bacterium]